MIVLIVPSRGRPDRMAAMARSAIETAEQAPIVVAVLDEDDPVRAKYRGAFVTHTMPRVGYTGALNEVGAMLWGVEGLILGAFGDDVLFRTQGWDRVVETTLATPGIAYGDDLIHNRNHPSAVFMSAAIAKALGWLALPATSHQWADDGWKALGQQAGVLRFMPEVIVEHMHPAVGKAEWDATYDGVFQVPRAESDHAGFTAWRDGGGLAADVAKVAAIR